MATDPALDPAADPMAADPMAGMSGGAAAPPPPAMDAGMAPMDAGAAEAPTAPEESENNVTQPDFDKLNKGGTVTKVKELAKIFNKLNDGVADADKDSFYNMVMKLAKKMKSH
jgi:hypothetical protein